MRGVWPTGRAVGFRPELGGNPHLSLFIWNHAINQAFSVPFAIEAFC